MELRKNSIYCVKTGRGRRYNGQVFSSFKLQKSLVKGTQRTLKKPLEKSSNNASRNVLKSTWVREWVARPNGLCSQTGTDTQSRLMNMLAKIPANLKPKNPNNYFSVCSAYRKATQSAQAHAYTQEE